MVSGLEVRSCEKRSTRAETALQERFSRRIVERFSRRMAKNRKTVPQSPTLDELIPESSTSLTCFRAAQTDHTCLPQLCSHQRLQLTNRMVPGTDPPRSRPRLSTYFELISLSGVRSNDNSRQQRHAKRLEHPPEIRGRKALVACKWPGR